MKQKAKMVLLVILSAAALSAAYAFKARSFIGYINVNNFYSAVWISAQCNDLGYGCVYMTNGMNYQIYTLSGIWMNPVKP